MSSTFADDAYGEFNKEKGNDGNSEPFAMRQPNSCVHTEFQADPWWAVDLGVALAVVGVLFTNRAENWGNAFVY